MPPKSIDVEDVYAPSTIARPADWPGYPARKTRKFPTTKHRGFVFTNFKTDWDVKEMETWSNVDFASVGLEKAPKTGKLHHQGCVYFKNPRTWSGVNKLLPPNCWFTAAKGDEMSNFNYTGKENRLLLVGVPAVNQGNRTDLESIRTRIIEEGVTPAELVCEEGVSYKEIQFAEAVFRLAGCAPKRTWKTSVIWLYGPSGRGKSHIAKALIDANDDCEAWKSSAKLDYWQQYQGHETIWFDEFRGDKCTFTALLEIMDNTPYEVNIKYGSAQLLARRLIVTSPMHPSKIYPNCVENLNQLLRRINVLWEIDELYAAASDGFAFPAVPEFKEFSSVVRTCAASRILAAPPIRYEGRKRLALINSVWVEQATTPTAPLLPNEATANRVSLENNLCSANSHDGNPLEAKASSHGLSSDAGTEVGGNIRPPLGTTTLHVSGQGPTPTSCPIFSQPLEVCTPNILQSRTMCSQDGKCMWLHPPDRSCERCGPSEAKLVSPDLCLHEATEDDGFGNELCLNCGEYVEDADVEGDEAPEEDEEESFDWGAEMEASLDKNRHKR